MDNAKTHTHQTFPLAAYKQGAEPMCSLSQVCNQQTCKQTAQELVTRVRV